MKILWLSWKDMANPTSGGAEFVKESLARKLVKSGHEVKFVVAKFPGSSTYERRDGFEIYRVGNRLTVYFAAALFYLKTLRHWPDLIIEEINTLPFMSQWYSKPKRLLFIHQLCREIWFYQIPFPFSLLGYLLEPLYLFFLRHNNVVTVSQSTKTDLLRYGFRENRVNIIPEIVELPRASTGKKISLAKKEIICLSLGSVRPMKRTLDQIKAFTIAKRKLPSLKFYLAGETKSRYGRKILAAIKRHPDRTSIRYLGRTSALQKKELMKKADLFLFTAVKEGWGLTITEAGSQALPTIAYNADGVRDSVLNGQTGLLTKRSPQDLGHAIVSLCRNPKLYKKLSRGTLIYSRRFTLASSYRKFSQILRKFA